LAQLKKANLGLLERIEADHLAVTSKASSISKQNENDYVRITQENTKLIATVNDLKFKVLNLEATLSTFQQQHKIVQKETEIAKENYRREVELLREEKNDLKAKNKRLG
jgi:hypothetical protein